MCMGEKIYVPVNGLVDCKRVLRNGKKRSKGRKCKFRCEKGFFLKRNKGFLVSNTWRVTEKENENSQGAAKPAKDGVVKCVPEIGWQSKPESLECLPDKNKPKPTQSPPPPAV